MVHIYIKEWDSKGFSWNNAWEIPFTEYTIDESDYRNKTATFDSPWRLKLGNRSWAVKITHEYHETFTGIILKRTEKPHNVQSYTCQDWNRLYMGTPMINLINRPVYDILKRMLDWYVDMDADFGYQGLLPKNKYEQGLYGSIISFNPMKNKKTVSVKDKPIKEIIEQLIYSQKPFIDIHYNNNGVMQFTPYHIDDFMNPVAKFHYTECIDFNYNFDTTDILTHVALGKKTYNFKDLFGRNNALSNFVITQSTMNEVPSNNTSNNNRSGSNNSSNKTSNNNDKTSNPYGTKKKEVWVNMDICWGTTTDNNYLKTFCKELNKLGWKTHNLGVNPALHTDASKAKQCKNGIWLTLDNGVDCEVMRHFGHDKWFKSILLNRNSRAVLGLINDPGNIKKGGKYYYKLGMAHDGTGKGNPGLRYPAGYCADCGLPFFYSWGRNPKDAARRFNSGGDSKLALQNSYRRRLKGYYANWNWGSAY